MKTLNIRESSARQYKNLQDLGAVLIVDPTFIEKAGLIAQNASNFYFEHPSMPNTTVMVFGRNESEIFGLMVDTWITTDNGEVINVPENLMEKRFCLKMGGDSKGSYRAAFITNVDRGEYGKDQLRIEEAIISLKKYGEIRPLRTLDNGEGDFQIHHKGYIFDARLQNIMWISKEDHKDIHKQITQSSHMRIVRALPNMEIPAFQLKT